MLRSRHFFGRLRYPRSRSRLRLRSNWVGSGTRHIGIFNLKIILFPLYWNEMHFSIFFTLRYLSPLLTHCFHYSNIFLSDSFMAICAFRKKWAYGTGFLPSQSLFSHQTPTATHSTILGTKKTTVFQIRQILVAPARDKFSKLNNKVRWHIKK